MRGSGLNNLFVATLATLLSLTNSSEARKAARSRVGLTKSDTELKAERQGKMNRETTACLNLANCYLARGDILRARNQSYIAEYNEAKRNIQKYLKWVDCGVDRINEKCSLKADICWMAAKQLAIEGLPELSFVNNCAGETIPYSHNRCIGLTPSHWPPDIAMSMKVLYPAHCTKACTLYPEYDAHHRSENRTSFPAEWDIGLGFALEDQDTRAIGRAIIQLAITEGFIKGVVQSRNSGQSFNSSCQFYKNCTSSIGLDTPRIKGLKEEVEKCGSTLGRVKCLKDLLAVPWVVPVTLYFTKRNIDRKSQRVTLITTKSTCRYNSWVGLIYDDLPYSVIGSCFLENRMPGSVVLDNRIGFYRTAELKPSKFVNCGLGDSGTPSYVRGATVHYGTEDGTEFIQTAVWHCSGRGLDVTIRRSDQTFGEGERLETVTCPQEMIVCSIRTHLTRIGDTGRSNLEQLKITNLGFGCCDVPKTMFYSAINYAVQLPEQKSLDYDISHASKSDIIRVPRNTVLTWPSYREEPVGCANVTSITVAGIPHIDYSKCRPLTKLCPLATFISEVQLAQWQSFDFNIRRNTNILAMDFKCTDYLNGVVTPVSISKELYKTDRFQTSSTTIDCGKNKYAYSITADVTTAEIRPIGRYVQIKGLQFKCSDNINNSPSIGTPLFVPNDGTNSYQSSNKFECETGQALCGFNVYPTNIYYSSGYVYRFICCPIPVRRIPITKCDGVMYNIARNTLREEQCKDRICIAIARGVPSKDVVDTPTVLPTTSHYPLYFQEVRRAVLDSTNFKYGSGFFQFFERNNKSKYNIETDTLKQGKIIGQPSLDRTTRLSSLGAALGALRGAPIAGNGFGVGDGIAGLSDFVNKQANPDAIQLSGDICKIVEQLNAVQDSLKLSHLYTRVQSLSTNLELDEVGFDDSDKFSEPMYFQVAATCGQGSYDIFGIEFFVYLPNKVCANKLPDFNFRLIDEVPLLDNLSGKTDRNFTVRFSRVGLVIAGDERNALSSWLKWDDVIFGLDSDIAFGQPGIRSGIRYAQDHKDLFKRPSGNKYYFADILVPAGMKSAIFQNVANCGRWELFTKILAYSLTSLTEDDINWDTATPGILPIVVRSPNE